jgi:hypothetical protein
MTAYANVAAGAPIYASTINDLILYAANRPMVLLALPANQSIPNNVQTEILYGASSEVIDTHGFHSTTVNTGRVTPTVAGVYLCRAMLLWAPSAQDKRVYVSKNGTAQGGIARDTVVDGGSHMVQTSREVEVNGATDYVSMLAFQVDSGAAARNATGAGDTTFSSFFSVTFMRGPT